MIRSLIAPLEITDETSPIIRRNFPTEKLEESIQRGDTLWIDMVDPDEKEVMWLEHTLKLHPNVVADIKTVDGRPTLMIYPKYLFVTLFEPAMSRNSVSSREIHCILGRGYFVTVRKSDAKAVDDAYDRVAQNITQWKFGEPYFLYLTGQYVVDSYYPLLDRMSNQLNAIEEALLTNGTDTNSKQKAVYVVKQQLIHLRQMVAPQREVLSSLLGEERVAELSEIRDLFRHLYERLLRVYDVIDAQRDLSTNILDLMASQESNKMADAVSRLTIFSMIFLPLTFFTGLFQIGFVSAQDVVVLPIKGIVLFILVVSAMVCSTILMVYLFRKRGWI